MSQENENKRRIARLRTILAAQILPGKGLPEVACQVRDVSETGARISLDDTAFLPDRFEFRIPRKNLTRMAVARWRREGMAGIEFIDEDAQGASEDGAAARIRQLEAENAELRRRVADLADRLFALGASTRTDLF